MEDKTLVFIGFNIFILVMLALDLGFFHKKSHVISMKEALGWYALWVSLALVFNGGLWYCVGTKMIIHKGWDIHIPNWTLLVVIASVLILAIGLSNLFPEKQKDVKLN
ncbi:MAG: hypothetical protein SGI71_11340 [Verrucomicrobiota bacterium]|nr:hypothetical protein [Verrucomicrobiota bacterium]